MRVPRSAATAGAGMPGDDLRPEARARTRFPGTAIHWCIWSYWYPREFSAAARAKVAAKKILAGRDFEGKKQSVRWVTEIEASPAHVHLPGFPELCGRGLSTGEARGLRRGASRAGSARVFAPADHRGRRGERLRPVGTCA